MNRLICVALFCLMGGALGALNPDNLLLGCSDQNNSSYVCVPVPSNAHFCHFPLECARIFLGLQPVDAVLWQPIFTVDGNFTVHSNMDRFRASLSGATISSPKNDSVFDATEWMPCDSYKSCMYHYLSLMDSFDGVLFRTNTTLVD